MIRFISFVVLIIAQTCLVDAQNKSVDSKSLLDSTVRYGKLENGFTYYLKHNEVPAGRIEMIFSVKAGYYQQNSDQKEYAHLLEHMGTFHTGKFPKLKNYTDSLGIYNYARTGFENTFYTLSLPSGDKTKLDAALNVLHEWANNILLKAEDVAVQTGAVIAEGRSKQPYHDWLLDTLSNSVLSNTGFGLMDKSAAVKSMRNVDLESLKDFQEKWYRPGLEAAIIVGDINVDSLESIIRDRFHDLRKSDNPQDPEFFNKKYNIELKGSNQYIRIADTIDRSPRICIVKKRINKGKYVRSATDLKEMLLQKLSMKILSELAGRFQRQYDPPFINHTNKFASNTLADGKLQTSYWEIPLNNTRHLKAKMIRFFAAIHQLEESIDENLNQKTKAELFEELSSKYQGSEKIGIELQDHFVSGNIVWTAEKRKHAIREVLSKIDVSLIKEFIDHNWNFSENSDFIFFNFPAEKLPIHETMMEWLEKGKRRAILQPEFVWKQIDSLPDQFSSVRKEDFYLPEESVIGVSEITTSNGIRLIFKPSRPATDSYKNEVSLLGYKEVPVAIEDSENYITATIAPDLIFTGDVNGYTKFQIEDYMLGKGMILNYKNFNNEFIINGKFKSPDVRDFFNIIYLYISAPTYNETAFEAWKKSKKMELNASQPYDLMIKGFIDQYRYTELPSLSSKDIDHNTYETYLKSYKKWFANLDGYTFIFTGDFKTDKLLPEIHQYISQFPTTKLKYKHTKQRNYYNFQKFSKTVPYPNINQAVVELSFPVKVEKDIKTQVELDLLTERLNQKIFEKLRIGSYSPRASGDWVDYENGIFAFNVSFNSDLGDQERMIGFAIDEFRALKENGITPEWLETTITQKRSKYGNQLETFWLVNFWPKYLKNSLQRKVDPQEKVLKYEAVLSHFIDQEDMNQAARKYFSEEKKQVIVIVPEKIKEVQ